MGRSFNFTYLFACVILFAVYAAPLEKENVDGQQLPSYGKWNVWISRWDRLRKEIRNADDITQQNVVLVHKS